MDNSQDAGDMQSAFQAFMLSSGGNNRGNTSGKKKKKRGPPTPSQTPPPSKATSSQQQSAQKQKIRKQYWQIFNAFRKSLHEDWLAVDDHLGQVIASIVNLRDRIQITSKQLWHCQYNTNSPQSGGFGYRKQRSNAEGHFLTKEDLELALSHGLIQHEKMLAGARKLISSLNQAQEALGRRLDELMTFHLDQTHPQIMIMRGDDEEEEALSLFAAQAVHWSRQVYTELANELYRKQCLVQTVVDSVDDGLIYTRESDDDLIDEDGSSPIKIAENCLREWPRGGSRKEETEYLADLLSSTPWEEDN